TRFGSQAKARFRLGLFDNVQILQRLAQGAGHQVRLDAGVGRIFRSRVPYWNRNIESGRRIGYTESVGQDGARSQIELQAVRESRQRKAVLGSQFRVWLNDIRWVPIDGIHDIEGTGGGVA